MVGYRWIYDCIETGIYTRDYCVCRLVVVLAGEFVQFFYADLDHPRRVTHMVDLSLIHI